MENNILHKPWAGRTWMRENTERNGQPQAPPGPKDEELPEIECSDIPLWWD
ncbi:hypothetical protein [Streptomyces sp. WAC07149]|uniref:hypothetical protein n=1 Tax=Streptomyces sp. WAC07149 TaxID=2487425 RepID=UPI00163C4A28|nr:hypothetical protein [Streptomyces sp. WAC07149]